MYIYLTWNFYNSLFLSMETLSVLTPPALLLTATTSNTLTTTLMFTVLPTLLTLPLLVTAIPTTLLVKTVSSTVTAMMSMTTPTPAMMLPPPPPPLLPPLPPLSPTLVTELLSLPSLVWLVSSLGCLLKRLTLLPPYSFYSLSKKNITVKICKNFWNKLLIFKKKKKKCFLRVDDHCLRERASRCHRGFARSALSSGHRALVPQDSGAPPWAVASIKGRHSPRVSVFLNQTRFIFTTRYFFATLQKILNYFTKMKSFVALAIAALASSANAAYFFTTYYPDANCARKLTCISYHIFSPGTNKRLTSPICGFFPPSLFLPHFS